MKARIFSVTLPIIKPRKLTLRTSLDWTPIILLLLAIALGLITTNFFYDPTSFAYFGFCITTFLFVILSSFVYVRSYKATLFKTPIVFFGLWCFYIFFQCFNHSVVPLFVLYFFALYFLLIGATILFSLSDFKFKIIFYGILLLSIIESLYCILQSLGIFKSHNENFLVTGSYNNPNVTAIFLALTTPIFLYFFGKKHKWLIRISFLILLTALLLLKCRAAFIGTIISIVVFYGLEYNAISWIKNNKSKPTVKALLILSLLIIIPLSSYLYNAKRASADGRKFIWKVSGVMALEKPLMGYGYGYFEKEYNLYQAGYIKNGKATSEELKNAGPVIMPHNELLHNLVEGGFVGLLLAMLFFGSLFLTAKQRIRTDDEKANEPETKNSYFNISYTGVLAFIGMSMVNSTIQIIPIMALLILYAGIICSTLKPLSFPIFFNIQLNSNAFPILFKTTTIVLSGYLLCIVSGIAIADRENKKAFLLQKEKHYEEALQIMPALKNNLAGNPNYWKNLGIIYMKTNNYEHAINCFSTAKKWSSLPDLYLGTGMCYEKLHQYPMAITEYKQLVLLLPSKFGYRFRLMQAYFKSKDTVNTVITAKEILGLEAKIPSPKIERYKKIAWSLLKKIEFERATKQKVTSIDGQFIASPFKIKS